MEPSEVPENLKRVKHIILVLSGKGGVGKSTVAVQLSLALAQAGKKVGLLDIDMCGPSIPKMLGVEDKPIVRGDSGCWEPVYADEGKRLGVMSMAFLLDSRETAIVWRGPKKSAMIGQFLGDVAWGDTEYLVVDTPPGTSDEHISACRLILGANPDGAVIVTTPQSVALSDVRKEITFCEKIGLPILGLIENMSGFVCPHCSDCTNIFGTGGGESLAQLRNVRFLGRLPIDPLVADAAEEGSCVSFIEKFPSSETSNALRTIVAPLLALDDDAPAAAEG